MQSRLHAHRGGNTMPANRRGIVIKGMCDPTRVCRCMHACVGVGVGVFREGRIPGYHRGGPIQRCASSPSFIYSPPLSPL